MVTGVLFKGLGIGMVMTVKTGPGNLVEKDMGTLGMTTFQRQQSLKSNLLQVVEAMVTIQTVILRAQGLKEAKATTEVGREMSRTRIMQGYMALDPGENKSKVC